MLEPEVLVRNQWGCWKEGGASSEVAAGPSVFPLFEDRFSLRPDWMRRWQMEGGKTERGSESATWVDRRRARGERGRERGGAEVGGIPVCCVQGRGAD